MSNFIVSMLVDALSSPTFLSTTLFFGAALGACCCGGHCRHNDDDNEPFDEDGDEEDDAPDISLGYSSSDMKEYEELVAQTDARITELTEALDEGQNPRERKEMLEELAQLYFQRAGRKYEEADEDPQDDFAAGFERANEYVEEFGESASILQLIANGRLAYAVLLNDEDEIEEADRSYQIAADVNQKLVDMNVPGARLDLAGIQLNRASILIDSGKRAEGFELLDDAVEEFQKLSEEDHSDPDPLFYLSQALATKANYLRDELDDEDFDSPGAREAIDAIKRAVDILTALVDSGTTQYRSNLGDVLLAFVAFTPKREKKDLEDALAALNRACTEYEHVVPLEPSACVDLFNAEIQRGDMLYRMELVPETIAWCDRVLETFDQFQESDELPMLEGLAVAFQRRAQLQKGKVKTQKTLDDLNKAFELQARIADSLIASLDENDKESGGCGCGHCGEHENSDCGCGHCGEHKDGDCGCGHCGEREDGDCGCGHCGEREDGDCGCGHCGGCGDVERQFLLAKWIPDNYNALMEISYERAVAFLELQKREEANAACQAALALQKAYKEVLREGERVESDFDDKLRDLRMAF